MGDDLSVGRDGQRYDGPAAASDEDANRSSDRGGDHSGIDADGQTAPHQLHKILILIGHAVAAAAPGRYYPLQCIRRGRRRVVCPLMRLGVFFWSLLLGLIHTTLPGCHQSVVVARRLIPGRSFVLPAQCYLSVGISAVVGGSRFGEG
jgi:hypothetical protein